MAETIQWENRIVGHGEAPANSFLAHEKNARRHPGKQRESLIGSLNAVGWVAPVVVSKNTGKILDGHARVEEALTRDEHQHIPYVEVDVSESEESLILATLDPITNLATYDKEALDSLLKDVSTGEPALQQMLAELAASQGLYLDSANGTGAGGDDFDSEAALDPEQTRVLKGDLWQLGEHRLLCGDSTIESDVKRACGSLQPFIMVTDPPYGVEYDPTWRDEAGGQFGDGKTKMRGVVANDDRADWTAAWELFTGNVVYCWHAGRHASTVQASLESAGFPIRQQIIWGKQHFVLSRGAYHMQHEPCWYAVRKGEQAAFCEDRTQSSLWSIASLNPAGGNKTEEKVGHGTQKPIECMARPIRNHGKPGDVVYDPFLGSGTTLVAAEREKRICVGIELQPLYASMCIARWEAETQKEAKLLERIV